jgi:hypothetical protein
MKRSTRIRPLSFTGRPSLDTTGAGRTPAVQTSVCVGTRSPEESTTWSAAAESIVVCVRTSTPRPRSSRAANSASWVGTSAMTRPSRSSSSQRMPWRLQRG